MKKLSFAVLIGATMLLSAFTIANSINWQIADGYSIKFTSKDPSGVFTEMTGDVVFDENDLVTSKFDVKVAVASINTGNGMKNKKAKSDAFFDVEKYPTINFTSTKFSKASSGYTVTGILDMHGVKKEISIPFTFVSNTFAASFNVNRVDYNIGATTGMSGKAAQELLIEISVPVTKK